MGTINNTYKLPSVPNSLSQAPGATTVKAGQPFPGLGTSVANTTAIPGLTFNSATPPTPAATSVIKGIIPTTQPVAQAKPVTPDYRIGANESIDQYNTRIASSRTAATPPLTIPPPAATNTSSYAPGSGIQNMGPNAGMVPPPPQSSGMVSPPQTITSQTPPQQNPVIPADVVAQMTQNAQQGSPVAASSAQALQGLGSQNPATSGPAFDAYTKAIADQQALKANIAKQYSGVETSGIPLEFQQGREQVMGRQYASQLDAAQQAVNQQQAGLGYQISGNQAQQSAYSTAGNLGNSAQGLQQAGLQGVAGLIPEGLKYGAFGGGSSLMDNAIQQAVQLAQKDPSNPQVQSLLSPFGVLGQQSFVQAMQQSKGGNYNPTADAATAANQATQAQNYTNQALTVDTNMKNLDNTGTIALNFLNDNKFLNPSVNQKINEPIADYIQQFAPGATTRYAQVMTDIERFQSALLDAGTGLTPTAVTKSTLSTNPRSLSAKDLGVFLDTLKQLGNSQRTVLQGQAQRLGGGGYQGSKETNNLSGGALGSGSAVGNAALNAPDIVKFFGGLGGDTVSSGVDKAAGFANKILELIP